MSRRYLYFLCLFAFLPMLGGRASAVDKSQCIAFVDVTVIPMDRQQVLPHRTVLVRGDRIAEITSAGQAKVPRQCTAIDGRQRFLIPGLVDSHVHLPLAERTDQLLILQILLANGITAGINMEGSSEILELRDEIRDGKLKAPTLYTTGIFIQQPAFMTPEQVRKEVIDEKRAGYDFIKVHGELTTDAYDTLFDTARAERIRVVGHVPSNLGIDAALGRQSLIVHAEEFLYSYFQFHRDLPTDPAEVNRMVRDIAKRTAESGTWVSPTLSVFRQIYIGVPQVNYGTDQINVVDNSIRGAGRRIDIGLSYELNGGGGLNVLSSGNDVQGVHTERLVGSGVKLVAGF